jgi:bacillithiol biosynthesis cysteine-adding enzyme BshC
MTAPHAFEQSFLSFEQTSQFSALLLDYLAENPALKAFYALPPKPGAFADQIKRRSAFPQHHRDVLCQVLQQQYAHIPNHGLQLSLLQQPNTFTVTTGHQLNIFSGPLYFIYKIASTIKLAEKLSQAYPAHHFVPVYWMATEDHDFAEISYFSLFGKKHTWEKEASGAVGRLSTSGMESLWSEIADMPAFFKEAYGKGQSLADATREYVHHLFGAKGLLVVDADAPALKALFQKPMEADLFRSQPAAWVGEATQALEALGYKPQIHAREINFFYMEGHIRERIVREDRMFKVLNTDIDFSPEEMQGIIANQPERLSPNVVMRPLYQEVILPNLAYLGGPAEVAYWLQLKPLFDGTGVPFPILMPRNFALVLTQSNAKKMEKLGIAESDLFLDEHALKMRFLEENASESFDVNAEMALAEQAFEQLVKKAKRIDPTLEGFIAAEQQKALKAIDQIEKRLRKAEEKNQETGLRQLQGLKEKLFPNGTPQERVENFLNFYLNDPQFIDKVLLAFDPFDFRMNILRY